MKNKKESKRQKVLFGVCLAVFFAAALSLAFFGCKEVIDDDGTTFSLMVNREPNNGGTVTKTPDKLRYDAGERVTLKATANNGFHFDYWSGASEAETDAITITMDSSKTITANFMAGEEGGIVSNTLVPPGYPESWEPPKSIPDATTIHTTLNAAGGDMTSTIQNAINAASSAATWGQPRVVELGAGTFQVNGTLLMKSNVVLRGQGQNTIFRGVNGTGWRKGAIVIGAEWEGLNDTYTGSAINVSGDVWAGAKSITVQNASTFSAGDILVIDRLADNNGSPTANAGPSTPWRSNQVGGNEWVGPKAAAGEFYAVRGPNDLDGDGKSAVGPYSSAYRPVKQLIEIESVSGNTLNLSNKINIDFPSKLSPQVYKTTAKNYQYIGIENMKLEISNGETWNNHAGVIYFALGSSYCWVKNVESDGSKGGFRGVHIWMNGFRNQVTGCYVHDSSNNAPGGTGYGIQIMGTEGLIDNNIADMLCKPILGYASGGGNVIAYNYVPNTDTVPAYWQETAIDTSHQAYSHSDLFEGNYAANISTDNTTGNNGQMVIFRNHGFGRNLNNTTTSNRMALLISGLNNDHVSIGNVWLSPANAGNGARLMGNPQNQYSDQVAYLIGHDARAYFGNSWWWDNDTSKGFPASGWAMSKFHRHLDYTPMEGLYDNPNNAEKTLQNSLYLNSAPDYFAGYTWPPVNPHGTTESERLPGLPAKDRYERGGW